MPSAFIVGGGRLASALVRGLRARGWEVAAHVRSARGRRTLARLGARHQGVEVAGRADLVFLAVADGSVREAFASVRPHLRRGQVVAHGAGALTLDPILGARRRGAHPGSLHVLQSLTGGPFEPGTTATVDGDPTAVRTLTRVARSLGLRPVRVPPDGRVLYHASAVMAANLVVALADLARETWVRSGAPRDRALPALLPLMRSAMENLSRLGPAGALTGPVARGDAAVVARQARALTGEARQVYRLLSSRLLALAKLKPAERRAMHAAIR
jgi:predicted short-subunit dehydrogenase-like oxidoreductase (DUF2520 family)